MALTGLRLEVTYIPYPQVMNCAQDTHEIVEAEHPLAAGLAGANEVRDEAYVGAVVSYVRIGAQVGCFLRLHDTHDLWNSVNEGEAQPHVGAGIPIQQIHKGIHERKSPDG